jgi:hypothetical protein
MKRFVAVLALVLVPALAGAQNVAPARSVDHDVLLAPNGTLFTVDARPAQELPELEAASTSLLQLTSAIDGESATSIVPASLTAGTHSLPALAFDAASDTLFLVWEHGRDEASGEILIASFHDGTWSEATVVSGGDAHRCDNLRVAALHSDGLLVLNAVWWERTSDAESARYAMLTVDAGHITNIERRSVNELYAQATADALRKTPSPGDIELLRHPMIVPSRESIDVVYGDMDAKTLRRVSIGMIPNVRIRIPGGRTGAPIGAPAMQLEANARIGAIAPGDGDNLLVYQLGSDAMTYSLFSNGAWSATRAIALGDVSTDRATDALRRMVSER